MMADTNELQTQRLDGSIHTGVDLAAKWPNFEEALRTIFGIPADTAMSEAMQIGVGPDVTMTGELSAVTGDPTEDLHAASRAYLQSQGSGLGVARARAYLTGSVYFTEGDTKYIPWSYADINVGSMWSYANPTRFTIPIDGDYMVGVTIAGSKLGDASHHAFSVYLAKNRSGSFIRLLTHLDNEGSNNANVFLTGISEVVCAPDCSAGDFLEISFRPEEGGFTLSTQTIFWAFSL